MSTLGVLGSPEVDPRGAGGVPLERVKVRLGKEALQAAVQRYLEGRMAVSSVEGVRAIRVGKELEAEAEVVLSQARPVEFTRVNSDPGHAEELGTGLELPEGDALGPEPVEFGAEVEARRERRERAEARLLSLRTDRVAQ